MSKTIKLFLITIGVLILTSCNNKKDKAGKEQMDTDKTAEPKAVEPPPPADAEPPPPEGPPPSVEIALDRLPSNIKLFVTRNYAGYTMQKAVHNSLCSGVDAIDLTISKKGGADYSLVFLPNGTFVQKEEDIDLTNVPSKVLEIIKEIYADYKPAPQIERITLADNTTRFSIDISNSNESKEVILKKDGTVVCEK